MSLKLEDVRHVSLNLEDVRYVSLKLEVRHVSKIGGRQTCFSKIGGQTCLPKIGGRQTCLPKIRCSLWIMNIITRKSEWVAVINWPPPPLVFGCVLTRIRLINLITQVLFVIAQWSSNLQSLFFFTFNFLYTYFQTSQLLEICIYLCFSDCGNQI